MMSITDNPQLFIIAGPNGAGKSTASSYIANKRAIVYDPDKESKQIFDKYAQLPVESVYYFINNHFQDTVVKAAKRKSDFILESNFRDHQIMDIVEQFRTSGYQANLILENLYYFAPRFDRILLFNARQDSANCPHF